MTKLKILPNNETVLIEGNKSYVFRQNGQLKTVENTIQNYLGYSINANYISILSSEDTVDIYSNGTSYQTSKKSMDCVILTQSFRKHIKMLQNTGETNGIRYNQVIFIYPETQDLQEILIKIK